MPATGIEIKQSKINSALPLPESRQSAIVEYAFSEQARAVFEKFNSLGGAKTLISDAIKPEPFQSIEGFDPYDGTYDIRPGYEDNYIEAMSPQDIDLINYRIDREKQNDEIIAASPLALSFAAGILDPINLIPISFISKGKTVLGTAGRFALAGGVTETGVEAVLQSAQETRTLQDSMLNIGMATILSGGLGAAWKGASKIDPSINLNKMVKEAEDALVMPEGYSVGAARTNEVDPKMLEVANTLGVNKAFAFQDPVMRLMHSPLVKARELVGKLAEINLMREGAAQGKVAAEIPVENFIKGWEANKFSFFSALDKNFIAYRQGISDPKRVQLNKARYSVVDSISAPKDKITKEQFYSEVSKAARRGGEHQIPEVAESARVWREKIVKPLAELAMNTKTKDGKPLLPENINDLESAMNYVTRLWDQNIIKGREADFDKLNISYLTKKRDASQERIDEWEDLLLKANQLVKDARKEARMAITDAKKQINESSKKLIKIANDEKNIKRQVARAERHWKKVHDRLIKFRPDEISDIDQKKYYRELLSGLKRGEPKEKPVTLLGFIRQNGGVKDPGKDLATEDITKITTGIINSKTGKNIDDIGEMATGAGYYRERPDVATIIDDIVAEIRGENYLYKAGDEDIFAEQAYIDALTADLDRAGYNINQIKDAVHLSKIIDNLPDSNASYRVSTPSARARYRELIYHEKRAAEELRKLDEASIQIEEDFIVAAQEARDAKMYGSITAKRINKNRKKIKAQERDVDEIRQNLERDKFFASFTDSDIADIAIQLRHRILNLPAGRFEYDYKVGEKSGKSLFNKTLVGARGPLKGRAYDIEDLYEFDGLRVEDFLVNDIESITNAYVRSMSAQVEMVRKFGDLDLEDEIKALRTEAEILKKKNPDKVKEINSALEANERDVLALRDRLHGTYEIPDDYSSPFSRAGRIAKRLNFMRFLGGMTLSAVPDVGRSIMIHGMDRTMRGVVVPLVKNRESLYKAMKEIPEAGTALDIVLNTRAHKIADLDDFIDPASKVENWLSRRSSEFAAISLMPQWNSTIKQFAGVIAQSRFIDDSYKWLNGAIEPKNKAFLLDHFIDEDMARRIKDQFERYGEIHDGVKIPNARNWDDYEAQEAFRAGIRKTVDKTIVTPGIDKPLWFSKGIGPIVSQFRSFGFGSLQRTTLAGLQQRDMAAFNGMTVMLGLGMLVYAAKTAQYGGELSDDPAKWIVEGVDRSGLTGWMIDANNITEKFTRGTVGLNALTNAGPMSRYASRGVLGSLGGPTVDFIEKMAQVSGAIATGETSASDIHAMRQLLMYQNHFAFRYLFDEAENGINNALGIPVKKEK